MRTTLNMDDDLLAYAMKLTGIRDTAALVRTALEALISQETRKQLAAMGGTQKQLKPIVRRRVRG
jgi:Arc/MetJ family transcription regulator